MIPTQSPRWQPGVIIAALLLLVVFVPVLVAPWLPLADPNATALSERLLPVLSPARPLGTDQLGRDLLSRLVWGAHLSLVIGVSATLLAALVGGVLGLAAGFFGRIADTLLMRGIDILAAFPYLLLSLAIVAALGPGLTHVMVAIAVANVPFFARSVRGAVSTLKAQDFIDAARLAGLGPGRILLWELLPNLFPVVFVLLATTLGWVVLESAGLSFLGLGAQQHEADLGAMIGEGRELLALYPRLAVVPGMALLIIVVGLNWLGDRIRAPMAPHRFDVTATGAKHESTDSEPDDESDEEVLLRVRDLRVSFPGDGEEVMAVAGVNLTLDSGERVALVGESGAGKTILALSLMRLVASPGTIRSDIRFAGQNIMTLPEASLGVLRGNSIAYVSQDRSATLDASLTIGDQLREAILAHKDLPKRELKWRMHRLLEDVRLSEPDAAIGLYPHQVSAGMRQRVAIAIALANGPELLIADEPTVALDLRVQEDILVLLDRLCREYDRALLFVSRDLGVAARLCRRVLVMYAGRIVEDAPVLELVQRPFHPYSRELIDSVPELGRPDKALTGIPDEMPDLANSHTGCAFASRCRHVIDACLEQEPGLMDLGDGRLARCIRVNEIV